MGGLVTFDIQRLMRLWTDDAPEGEPALAAFRAVYADPVVVNGRPFTAADLVARAAALREAFERLEREVLDIFESGDQVAVAFRMSGRQTGPLVTSAGVLPPSGERLNLRVIDLLTVSEDRISRIWMVADELGALAERGLVRLGAG
jgi:predicted ester cyclase